MMTKAHATIIVVFTCLSTKWLCFLALLDVGKAATCLKTRQQCYFEIHATYQISDNICGGRAT